MKTYTLTKQQVLPITVDEAWDFFCDPANLSKITPKDMGFTILTDLAGKEMYPGMLIEYRVKPLLGIPVNWVTKIGAVDKPHLFTDTQLKGPYSLWEHTHKFVAIKGGVEMTDIVKYAIPFGILGQLAHVLFVKSRLEHIFNYRKEVLEQIFSKV